jgi:hypothetical protein
MSTCDTTGQFLYQSIFKKVTKAAMKIVLASAIASCSQVEDGSMIGNWVSREGYSITIYDGGTYKFCERQNCFSGIYQGFNNDLAHSVDLMAFKDNPIGLSFKEKYLPFNDDAMLSVNEQSADLAFPRIAELCGRSRCVSFGGSGGENIAVFRKIESP